MKKWVTYGRDYKTQLFEKETGPPWIVEPQIQEKKERSSWGLEAAIAPMELFNFCVARLPVQPMGPWYLDVRTGSSSR